MSVPNHSDFNLALRVIAERLENREAPAEFLNVTFQAA